MAQRGYNGTGQYRGAQRLLLGDTGLPLTPTRHQEQSPSGSPVSQMQGQTLTELVAAPSLVPSVTSPRFLNRVCALMTTLSFLWAGAHAGPIGSP